MNKPIITIVVGAVAFLALIFSLVGIVKKQDISVTPNPDNTPVDLAGQYETNQPQFGAGIKITSCDAINKDGINNNGVRTCVSNTSIAVGTTTIGSVVNPLGKAAFYDVIIDATTPSTVNLGIYTATSSSIARYATSSIITGNAASYGQNLFRGALLPNATTTVSSMSSTTAVDQTGVPVNSWIASSSDFINPTSVRGTGSTTPGLRGVAKAGEFVNVIAIPRKGDYTGQTNGSLRGKIKIIWQAIE